VRARAHIPARSLLPAMGSRNVGTHTVGITRVLEGSKWWTRTALVIACGALIAGASEGIAPDNVSLERAKDPGWCWANAVPWVFGGCCVKDQIDAAECWEIGIKTFQPFAAMEYSKTDRTCTLHTWSIKMPSTCPKDFIPRKSSQNFGSHEGTLKDGVVELYKGSGHTDKNMECWHWKLEKEIGWCAATPRDEHGEYTWGGYCTKEGIEKEADCWRIGIKSFPHLAAMDYYKEGGACSFYTWDAGVPSNCPPDFEPKMGTHDGTVQAYKGNNDSDAKCLRFERERDPSTTRKCKAIPKEAYQQMQQKPSKCPT